jgi:hypothetical protein
LEGPIFRIGDHQHEFAQDGIVLAIDFSAGFSIEVFKFDSELNPSLGLGGFGFGISKLADERRFVPSFSPRFGQIRANGARRASHLVGQ